MKAEMSAKAWKAVNTVVSDSRIDGVDALRVEKSAALLNDYDENTYARLIGSDFHNGVIEVKLRSRLLPDAPELARGFIGIAFRISDNDAEFESFYLRPTNAMTDDPVRRAHGCQYFSYPGYTFAYFRRFGIEGYESPIDCGLDEWITLRAEIRGAQAAFYLNGRAEPVLRVDGLKHGPDARGGVGLFVDIGTEAFFSDVTVTCED